MNPTLEWLMQGDPSIRWQVMRDLLDEPAPAWQAEQRRTLAEGWGCQYLALQAENGSWGGGIYSPKWISTTYTLLDLRSLGLPRDCPQAQKGVRLLLARLLGEVLDEDFQRKLLGLDRCIVGMALRLAVYFQVQDERIDAIVQNLLDERMPDGAWNCERSRPYHPEHSSVHTTINVLEGLRDYLALYPGEKLAEARAAEQSGFEMLLRHRLFRSHRTGEVIHPIFLMLSFPGHWFYNVLRGLEAFAYAAAPRDPRLQEAIDMLQSKRRADGTWPVQHRHAGLYHFSMEKTGGPSRWNTLRALRVLRWWDEQANP